ncbi:hypothetical protein F0L68_01400 [Solihabitans fulvus]|uniref:FAD-dependent urate hydroxylase HpyO/Asp monooxygenase CreE-like FAD/NAD(P)-binding domain-containing protein n=1 Tax=Solihabitans fulvus TaxID=1892852 RepID=A0A5B2XUE7_9PSEU|nr:FAD/NAD(P)-binding protein [Solihabitans fulvus]KAA2266434.1 hypothetical protein F0L68_01400 [Solihabitans fulvus]
MRERTVQLSAPRAESAYRVAVVGSGPRGLMAVERMAARLAERPVRRPVEILLIDAVEVGAGRIYRTNQPPWFLLNTVAGMVSAFSGLPDDGPTRAGSGPSLYEWWRTIDPVNASPDGYAARADYGRYLRFVLDAVEGGLPDTTTLRRIRARVADLQSTGTGYLLTLTGGESLAVDRVVLTTGHSQPELTGPLRDLAEFAADRPRLRYLRGDSAADMPLDAIPAGTPVGVLGLGLSFYDVMAAFSLGRGGRFTEADDGGLRYHPSGREPVLVAGSRSGMPLPARGCNQKPPRFGYRPVLFTEQRVRRNSVRALDFRADVLPWLLAEIDLVYYATALRQRFDAARAAAFTSAVAARAELPDVVAIAAEHGIADLPRLNLDALARPFADRSFPDRPSFERELASIIRRDLVDADRGNVDSPLKAALDVLRDCRRFICQLVDYSGLTPSSHRDDFLGWYVPRSAFLAAGPPSSRLRQLLALIECGVLRVIGPRARFACDAASGRFTVSSPQVAGAEVAVDVVIDARIPYPDLPRDLSPLTRRLRERGIWTGYVNGDGAEAFHTGGVAVTGSPYHPVARDGEPDTGLYVVGIPTEHTRWFMQVGSNRPGLWGDFVHDSDAIAADVLAAADWERVSA